MTWVIGRAGPFGYAVGVSDIRVTLSNGTEHDCLQKIHYVGPQMALGFAGSVAIGFKMVYELSRSLYTTEKDAAWDPLLIANDFPGGAQRIFSSFSDRERAGGCQLILLSAHPTENDGAAPWARCYVYRFHAPDFAPVLARPAQIVSIGSGSAIEPYQKALARLENDFDLFKFEIHIPGGSAIGIMSSISSVLQMNPVRGISDHVHFCIVGRDGMRIGKNDLIGSPDPGANFIMPPTAQNPDELKQLLSQQGISSVEYARC